MAYLPPRLLSQAGDTIGVVYDQGTGSPCVELFHKVSAVCVGVHNRCTRVRVRACFVRAAPGCSCATTLHRSRGRRGVEFNLPSAAASYFGRVQQHGDKKVLLLVLLLLLLLLVFTVQRF